MLVDGRAAAGPGPDARRSCGAGPIPIRRATRWSRSTAPGCRSTSTAMPCRRRWAGPTTCRMPRAASATTRSARSSPASHAWSPRLSRRASPARRRRSCGCSSCSIAAHPIADLHRWARGAQLAGLPVDPAVLQAGQPIYTARPIFRGSAPRPGAAGAARLRAARRRRPRGARRAPVRPARRRDRAAASSMPGRAAAATGGSCSTRRSAARHRSSCR